MMMRILHVEDYDKEKGRNYAVELNKIISKEKIEYENIETLDSFLSINPEVYDIIILDGQFPSEKGFEPDIDSFKKAMDFLKNKNYDKRNIIVWSNSTRVHAICSLEGLKCFSKKQMKEEDYIRKGVDPKAIVEKADEQKIKNLILNIIP